MYNADINHMRSIITCLGINLGLHKPIFDAIIFFDFIKPMTLVLGSTIIYLPGSVQARACKIPSLHLIAQ